MKYGMTVAMIPAATISNPDLSQFFSVKLAFHTPIPNRAV
jgi:hypothetical protein